ncbi:SET domain-containing protein [Vibrio pelagius]|uniref:SET domain-containing protein n=1 Tax=Vibrio pelagius TaxID=28169 RepID=A0ABY5G7H3_VIBPE|nr:SET domain-containing protein [Vibrio pelagius]UTT86151.1 SET domain-containing protein [Vibrio pelagius]
MSVTNDLKFVIRNTLDNISETYISKSSVHGFGLFSKKKINKGTTLGFLDGQVMTLNQWDIIKNSISQNIPGYSDYFFMECNYMEKEKLLVRPLRTKYSYINHNRKPNLEINKDKMSIVTRVDVEKDEELFLDYRLENLPSDYINGSQGRYL